MLLSAKHIKEAFANGTWIARRDGLRIMPDEMTINPNSVNVSLGRKILIPRINRPSQCYVDLHDPKSLIWQEPMKSDKIKEGEFHLTTMDFILMHTRESFDCSKPLVIDGKQRFFAPMIEGRSTVARCGLSIHATAGYGDYGFDGSWTLEVTAQMPIILREGDEIAQVYFEEVSDNSRAYCGAYKDQYSGPQAPVIGKDRFQRRVI